MPWAGAKYLIEQYQRELHEAAERDRLANEATRARSAERRLAWQRLVTSVLGGGGR